MMAVLAVGLPSYFYPRTPIIEGQVFRLYSTVVWVGGVLKTVNSEISKSFLFSDFSINQLLNFPTFISTYIIIVI